MDAHRRRPSALRERTRRAVQKEIAAAANALFAAHGYEATTVDDIAAAAGMSQRSVFRYFPTKEDIVLGKVGFAADEMLAALRDRPAGEPVWDAFRHVFGLLVREADEPERRAIVEMHRIIFETPALLAGYLQKLQHVQDAALAALTERAAAEHTPYAPDDPTPRALVAAAFGCLVAAQQAWHAGGAKGSFADALDRAMAAVRPAG